MAARTSEARHEGKRGRARMRRRGGLEVVVVSLEGPDPYSQAGGLGVRVRELSRALAAAGFPTSVVFVGDPARPGEEVSDGVRLLRWAQHISYLHPEGVYAGEEATVADLETWLPHHLAERVVRPAAERGAAVALLFEEWHTARLTTLVDAVLRARGLRGSAVLLWNANNRYGFERIDWDALAAAAEITTVSRYMKHLMWRRGVNPTVIPNGIPESALSAPPRRALTALRRAGGPCLAVKIGRFTPDKRWLQAVDAVALLRSRGLPARLLMRGGIEAHGGEVLSRAAAHHLAIRAVDAPVTEVADLVAALDGDEPVIDLRTFLPDAMVPVMAAAATGVLANSGHEPFGLVGLEAMAAGGVAFVGPTGEDYARPYVNSIVVETDDPDEVATALEALVSRPALGTAIRERARADAEEFAWPVVVEGLVERLRFVARRQGTALPI